MLLEAQRINLNLTPNSLKNLYFQAFFHSELAQNNLQGKGRVKVSNSSNVPCVTLINRISYFKPDFSEPRDSPVAYVASYFQIGGGYLQLTR